MSLKPVRLAVGLCALIVTTFVTSCLVATLTQPLERVVSVMSSVFIQQWTYAEHRPEQELDARATAAEKPTGSAASIAQSGELQHGACQETQCVVEVDIGDTDYTTYFKGVSPLSPTMLSKGVNILAELGRDTTASPAVVVMDLDLSFGKADASERIHLLDSLVRLSATTPVLLVCPKNFIDAPDRVGRHETDYLHYVTRQNATHVATGGGVYFFRSGIDRFALFYDEASNHAGNVTMLATKGGVAERRDYALHPERACQQGITAGYGKGSKLIRPVDDAILKTTWHQLHTGEQEVMYAGNVLLIGGSYLGNDKFSFLSEGNAVSGSRLHGYIIQEQLSGSSEAPETFSSFFDVFVGILSGFAFIALWRIVSRTEQHYAANLLAHAAFFAFAVLLPLLLLFLSYRFSQLGISFASAGMVVSALFDAFFTPQETEGSELFFAGHTVPSLLALLLLVSVSVALLTGIAYQAWSVHVLLGSIALGGVLQWYGQTRSGLLVFVCALLLAGYFLVIMLQYPHAMPVALPLLVIGVWLFSFTRQGQELLAQPDVPLKDLLLDVLLSRSLLLFVVAVLVYGAAAGLYSIPGMDDLAEWWGGEAMVVWLCAAFAGKAALAFTQPYRQHADPRRWGELDTSVYVVWETFKNLLAIHALAGWLVPSAGELLPWPAAFMLVMLLLLVVCAVYGRYLSRSVMNRPGFRGGSLT